MNNLATKSSSDLPPPEPGTQRHILAAEEELRLEVSSSKQATTQLHLRTGSAELWGLELGAGQAYTLKGAGGLQIALFTWHGATIDVTVSDPSLLTSAYCSTETVANVAAVNTHAQLEALRDQAVSDETKGPRVLIVGPREAGKTSLAKTLTAYAVKLGRTPILVDLDPSDNCMTVPGTLSACAMTEACLEVASHATTGLPVAAQPLTLWHGSSEVLDRIFSAQVESLAQTIQKRCANDPNCRSSGIIVNTNTTQEQLLLETVRTLDISVILVIGHDRLYSVLSSQTGSSCTVVKLPRSGGVVSRTAAERTAAQHRSIRQYLYGTQNELTPTAVPLDSTTGTTTILRVRTVALSQHLLPVAQQQTTASIQYDTVNADDGNALQSTDLVAVSTQGDVTVGIAGCGVVDTGRLLCPSAGRMPTPTVVLTAAADAALTWME